MIKEILNNMHKRHKTDFSELEIQLTKLSHDIISYDNGRFRNIPLGDSETYNELKKLFPEYESLVMKYTDMLFTRFNHAAYEYMKIYKQIPLPPFVVFPTYTATTIGWRMGIGEKYAGVWYSIIKTLSPKELTEYCEKYTYPSWWKECGIMINGKKIESFSQYEGLPWQKDS